MINLRSIKDAQIKNKTVFLRVDLDVPIENGKITDTTRLKAWFPTLEYLVRNGAKVIIAGHLGRPKPAISRAFSLELVVKWIANKVTNHKSQITKTDINGFSGWKLAENVLILENLRFYEGEEKNDPKFAEDLSKLADIYVNDAFASSHRAHASIVGITKFLPSFAGLRLLEEVRVLSQVLEDPKRPLCVIIGGAKIETKLPLVCKMHKFADYVLVGGEIVTEKGILDKEEKQQIEGRKAMMFLAALNPQKTDAIEKDILEFIQIAGWCKTIVWNGPVGKIEEDQYSKGTLLLARGIASINAYKIVGGGDTVGFLQRNNLLDAYNFVSIGGGAMLEFLSGETLPGIEVLEEK